MTAMLAYQTKKNDENSFIKGHLHDGYNVEWKNPACIHTEISFIYLLYIYLNIFRYGSLINPRVSFHRAV